MFLYDSRIVGMQGHEHCFPNGLHKGMRIMQDVKETSATLLCSGLIADTSSWEIWSGQPPAEKFECLHVTLSYSYQYDWRTPHEWERRSDFGDRYKQDSRYMIIWRYI